MERWLIGCELWSLTISWETQPLFTELQHFFQDTQNVCVAGRKGKGKPQGKWHWNAGVFATSSKHNNADSYSPYFFSSQKETKNQNKIQRKEKKSKTIESFLWGNFHLKFLAQVVAFQEQGLC